MVGSQARKAFHGALSHCGGKKADAGSYTLSALYSVYGQQRWSARHCVSPSSRCHFRVVWTIYDTIRLLQLESKFLFGLDVT